MIHEIVNLKDYFPLKYDVTLECYCPSNYDEIDKNRKRKSIVVYPGGGYEFTSEREAEPVALQFLQNDVNTFVLKYSCGKEKALYPTPLLEALAAVAYLRKYKDKYNVDENKIIVMGFSAGGHLAALTAASWHVKEYAKALKVTNDDIKVNGCILGYPVISMKPIGHWLTTENFTHNDEELIKKCSVEDLVTENFPKTFVWHTCFDDTVPVQNTLLLVNALTNKKVPYELHIFPNGPHGISLANHMTEPVNYHACVVKQTEIWIKLCLKFVKEEF